MKKKIVIGIIVIILIGAGVIYKIENSKALQIEVAEVTKDNIYEYVEETGTVKADNERIVYSQNTGNTRKILVHEGDIVKTGDALVELDTDKIDLEIKSLEAKLEGLKAEYKEAIKPVDKEKINQTKAKIESINVQVEEAKRDVGNNKKLYKEGAISADTYRKTLNNLEIQENSLKEAQNELALLQKGASSNIKNQYEAQIASMTYEIQKLEDTKNDYIIKAPTDGKILDVYIKESAFLQPGTKVIEIGNINRLYVEADILATDVGNVAKDQKAIVTSDDIDIGELKGVVSKVYPKAFSKLSDLGIEQKRVKVDVDLNNISSKLKAGYDVTTKIVTNEKNNVLQIPKNSVFQMENKNYVFVVENSKVKLRQIKTGIEGDDNIEVISGLKEGEKVIISPDKDIKEGIKVSIKK